MKVYDRLTIRIGDVLLAVVGGNVEYPLFEAYKDRCPTARYVGGTSRYLCECEDPRACAGVKQMLADEQARIDAEKAQQRQERSIYGNVEV